MQGRDCSKVTAANGGNNRLHKELHQHRVAENDGLDESCRALLVRSLPNGSFPAIGESPVLILLCNHATVSEPAAKAPGHRRGRQTPAAGTDPR